jgi:hypothetical protein
MVTLLFPSIPTSWDAGRYRRKCVVLISMYVGPTQSFRGEARPFVTVCKELEGGACLPFYYYDDETRLPAQSIDHSGKVFLLTPLLS